MLNDVKCNYGTNCKESKRIGTINITNIVQKAFFIVKRTFSSFLKGGEKSIG